MPPTQFIAKVSGTLVGSIVSFAVPTTVRAGDPLIAIIAADPTVTTFNQALPANAGWELLGVLLGATATIITARRLAASDDRATVTLTLGSVPVWSLSVLSGYRGSESSSPVVGAFTNIAAATAFVCPSQTFAAYSGTYVGIAVVTSAAVAVTPPAGTTERSEELVATRTLEIFDYLPETTGATGTKTATTAANQTGVAASLALLAEGLRGAGKVITAAVPGMLGLPTVGV